MQSNKKTIVISAINFYEGGPLTIMIEALNILSNDFSNTHRLVALVNSKKLYNHTNIEFFEFPKSRKSWFIRLYYEYFYFRKLSKKLKPDFWLSMHDITPNVDCEKKFVYCHNPAPFFKPLNVDFKYGFTTYLFSKFYKYLYKMNISKNKFVIVQQDWLRDKFKEMFKVNNVLVAHPENEERILVTESSKEHKLPKKLFYPCFPRSFKNIEIVCEAYKLLPEVYKRKIIIYFTIDKSLNKYSRKIINNYGLLEGLKFIGLISREEVFNYYRKVDGLIFPSRLETWGLPISEFKQFDKAIFLSDLPYAHETLGDYKKAKFFNPFSADDLSQILKDYIDRVLLFDENKKRKIEQPFVKGWKGLFNKILDE